MDPVHGQRLAGPFRTPDRTWTGMERCFMPWPVAGAVPAASIKVAAATAANTTVNITNAGVGDIDLVLSFCPSNTVPSAVSRVAAFQTVSSNVRIDLTRQATLYWMVTVYAAGELAPNQAGQPYSDNSDSFRLEVTRGIAVTHDASGWLIPAYDSTRYTIHVGFGLNIQDVVYWGCSVPCSPQQTVLVCAGSYELARSDGHEQIGDPVVIQGASDWQMPIGYGYLLVFDAVGNGTLTRM